MRFGKVRTRRAPAWSTEAEIGGSDFGESVHEARRLRIAAATAQAIGEHGLASASLKNIANQLGFTVGVIQHYFDSKEQLLEFTKTYYIRKLIDEAVAAGAQKKGVKRLHVLCEMILPLTPDRRQIWELLIAFNGGVIGDREMMRAQSVQYRRSVDIFSQAWAELKKCDVDSCLADALGLLALVEGLSYHMIFSTDGYSEAHPAQIIADYIASIDRGLKSRVTPGK
jgi:AcrR family transcriptional regulator